MPLPELKGYLTKRALSGKSSWKRRWFVLDDKGILSYYADPKDATKGKTPKGSIVLNHTMKCVETNVDGHRVLEVSTGDATLVAYPDEERAIGDWIEQLEIAGCMCAAAAAAR